MWVYILIAGFFFNVGTSYLSPQVYYQVSHYYPQAFRPNYINYNTRCCWYYSPPAYNQYYTYRSPYWPLYPRYAYPQNLPVYQSTLSFPFYGGPPTTKRLLLAITTTSRPMPKPSPTKAILTSTTTPLPPPTSVYTRSDFPSRMLTTQSTPTSGPDEATAEKEYDDRNGSGDFSIDDEDLE
ncbi:hypothetical protein Trydic_g13901 [Trypoxylus dichotomus]